MNSKQSSLINGAFIFMLISLLQFTPVSCYGDLSRTRLTTQAEHNLAAITSHAVVKATELVDSVVDDLLMVDSHNKVLLSYLSSFEDFLAISGNQTKEVLQSFYDIVGLYLDTDVAEKTSRIETQLIAFLLQRNVFDRWKRTVQLRTTQLLKSFGTKLRRYAETLDQEERAVVEQRWKLITVRNGQRKLEKFRNFVGWLAR